jgi:archaeosine synthase
MFEATHRDGLARTGNLGAETGIYLPAMLFASSASIIPPSFSKGILVAESGSPVEGVFNLYHGGHAFHGDGCGKEWCIPNHLVYPDSCRDLNKVDGPVKGATGPVRILSAAEGVDEIPEEVEVVVAPHAAEKMGNPMELADYLVTCREIAGPGRVLYASATGLPSHIALLAYCGVDLFDSLVLIAEAHRGNCVTTDGIFKSTKFKGHCHCAGCEKSDGTEGILEHNYRAAQAEITRVAGAIASGSLRELVESRVRSSPWTVAMLRHLDRNHYASIERYLPINKDVLLATSADSLKRPEVRRFRNRIRERYSSPPGPRVLLFIPCSARKPYSRSKTHKAIGKAVSKCGNRSAVHAVVLTSPLGAVPTELELFYPARVYDIAVTGQWDHAEKQMIVDDVHFFLKKGNYGAVVTYLPNMEFAEGAVDACGVKEVVHLNPKDPRHPGSLEELTRALREKIPSEKISKRARAVENFKSIARFQFGAGAEGLVEEIAEKRNQIITLVNGKQTSALTETRGMLSLSLEGGKILADAGIYCVKIHDFDFTGSIFAGGIMEADEIIRPGDDVAVVRNGSLAGVGVASMSGPEMNRAKKGLSIKIRHRCK